MRVLLIEDDVILGQSLKEYLTSEEIETIWLEDERNILEMLTSQEFDVIVLDLILKYSAGEDLISLIREKGIKTPILVLTAKQSINDKEICFLRGADDYLTKPFHTRELVLRIQTLSRRKPIDAVVRIGDVIVNLDAKAIYKSNRELKITKTAWKLLTLLIKHRGEIVSTETIMNYVWAGRIVGDEVLRAYIKELRKILPPESIETHKGRGYKLI